MREEVTMVIADTSYLELCQAFNAHTSTKTHRHTEDSGFILHAEENKNWTIRNAPIFKGVVKYEETTEQVWRVLLIVIIEGSNKSLLLV